MEILLQIETRDFQKVKELLLKDNTVGRASILFKDAKPYGQESGYYVYISGIEEQCKKALEITKEISKEIKDKKKEEIIKKIKDEENKAMEGFGSIFS